MKSISLTIDNKHIHVKSGTSILEASKLVGIYIPTLCNHPDLPPTQLELPIKKIFQTKYKIIKNTIPNKTANGCNICIVEIKGKNGFFNSCNTLVEQNMTITTNNNKIKKQRKLNILPILSRHKHSCLLCAQQEGCSQTQCSSNIPEDERCCHKFSNCELKNLVNFIGIPDNIPKQKKNNIPYIHNQPLFSIDYNLCIACTRCVRACGKLRDIGAIGFVWDDLGNMQVGSFESTLEKSGCVFCTTCVEVCPTGALKDKLFESSNKENNLVSCKTNCPVHIDIPKYLRMIALGKFEKAYKIVKEKMPFPSILGRICTHPCEEKCRRKEIDSAVAICALKRFISDINQKKKFSKKLNETSKNTGKKIAIIGAGPTGMTASFYLRKKGHNVIVYDKKSKMGGTLRYGIPEYRLPNNIIDNEVTKLISMGVKFIPNYKLGINFNLNYLKKTNIDAILIAIGAQKDYFPSIELDKTLNPNQILGGTSFLHSVAEKNNIKIKDKVLIIGGGNVAIDVSMTVIRCGAQDVSIVCLESYNEMPANKWDIKTAESEGVKIIPSWYPIRIINKNNNIIELEVAKCFSVFNNEGDFDPKYDEKTKKRISTNQILIATGQKVDLDFINLNNICIKNGIIIVDHNTLETKSKNIYAGGDVISFNRSVINAVASGRKAAKSIDAMLGGTGKISNYTDNDSSNNTYIKKNKEFIKWNREKEKELSSKIRTTNFKEIILGFDINQAKREAARCLQCDIRLTVSHSPSPPSKNKIFPLTNEILNKIIPNETEGVYTLFNENNEICSIIGTKTIRNDLSNIIKNSFIGSFEFEKNKMYSKRESELIQKYLQKYGKMPRGNDGNDLDDLF